jgi:hypothetical protein
MPLDEFLMPEQHRAGRPEKPDPELAGFGIDMRESDVVDALVDDFNTIYRGTLTVEELVLHPREAIRFCDDARRKHGWYGLPDYAILRWLMELSDS